MRSGCASAIRKPIGAPKSCTYMAYVERPSASVNAVVSSAKVAKLYSNSSAEGIAEWPKPRWSGAITRYDFASSGIRLRNMCELVGKPCSNRITGASAAPASR